MTDNARKPSELEKAAAILVAAGFAVIPMEERDRLVALDAATSEFIARVVANMRAGRKPSEMPPAEVPDELAQRRARAFVKRMPRSRAGQ